MTQMSSEGREYKIRVTLADVEVSSLESIRNIPVTTRSGIYPLSFFANIKVEEGVSKLLRMDKKSSVEITASLLPDAVLSKATGDIEAAADEILPREITLKWAGDAEMMTESYNFV